MRRSFDIACLGAISLTTKFPSFGLTSSTLLCVRECTTVAFLDRKCFAPKLRNLCCQSVNEETIPPDAVGQFGKPFRIASESSVPTLWNPNRRATARTRSSCPTSPLSCCTSFAAAAISIGGRYSALRIVPVSLLRSRTGGVSACADVIRKAPSRRSSASRCSANRTARAVASAIRFPVRERPKAAAIRRAISSACIGPSIATMRETSSESCCTVPRAVRRTSGPRAPPVRRAAQSKRDARCR